MKRLHIKNLLVGALILILFSGFFPGKDDLYFQISKNIDLFAKVYKEISFNYVDDINPEEFMRAGIRGMLSSLDPYTIFVDENKKDEIELITNGKYGGVGITIGVRGDNVTVVEVLDGYSAQKQGIRVGDVLIEAAGVMISPENIDEISSLVKGEPGTSVEVIITRNEARDTIKFDLLREEVLVKNIMYYGFYPSNSSNVYIKLANFSRTASDELKKALQELKAQREIKSIILDLRGNPGGLLDVAVDICDKFLKKDMLIVTTRGKDAASERKYYSVQEPLVGNANLIVLVNEGSASASEIVAGAIQDHDRGLILGTKTFGKGLVQTITPLSYNTSLKITTAKYYTPSGRCIQRVDYAKSNKVINDPDSLIESSFQTDNKRYVYSAGGITPDSIVQFSVEGDITKELLAKGVFFKFADNFYYANSSEDLNSFSDEILFSDFEKYLSKINFVYRSEAEKQIEKLIADTDSKKMNKTISEELNKLKLLLEKSADSDLKAYKKEIMREIKSELASRYLGAQGKIIKLLEYDEQFQAALKIFSDSNKYDKLLNLNE
jgi:carboxyl-terminal processing protease